MLSTTHTRDFIYTNKYRSGSVTRYYYMNVGEAENERVYEQRVEEKLSQFRLFFSTCLRYSIIVTLIFSSTQSGDSLNISNTEKHVFFSLVIRIHLKNESRSFFPPLL